MRHDDLLKLREEQNALLASGFLSEPWVRKMVVLQCCLQRPYFVFASVTFKYALWTSKKFQNYFCLIQHLQSQLCFLVKFFFWISYHSIPESDSWDEGVKVCNFSSRTLRFVPRKKCRSESVPHLPTPSAVGSCVCWYVGTPQSSTGNNYAPVVVMPPPRTVMEGRMCRKLLKCEKFMKKQ